jgi:hypothetical protein
MQLDHDRSRHVSTLLLSSWGPTTTHQQPSAGCVSIRMKRKKKKKKLFTGNKPAVLYRAAAGRPGAFMHLICNWVRDQGRLEMMGAVIYPPTPSRLNSRNEDVLLSYAMRTERIRSRFISLVAPCKMHACFPKNRMEKKRSQASRCDGSSGILYAGCCCWIVGT